MFLSRLNEKSKSLFVQLAKCLCEADGDFDEHEQAMLDMYCKEMGIRSDTTIEADSADETIKQLVAFSNDQERKIILFELVGLASIDSDYSAPEKKTVEAFATVSGLEAPFVQECQAAVDKYLALQAEIDELLLG